VVTEKTPAFAPGFFVGAPTSSGLLAFPVGLGSPRQVSADLSISLRALKKSS